MNRLYMTLTAACVACVSVTPAQKLAVYESEANAEEYHGIYQEPLRAWLTQRGQPFEAIGDEVASDPQRLADYPVVLASSVYLVPESAAQGLTEYLRSGGRVIWIDSPARCHDPDFRGALGLGPASTYVPGVQGAIERRGDPCPAALSIDRCEVKRLAGNPAVTASPEATVLYELTGSATGGAPLAYPAVILSACGEGTALVYNWIVWTGREPEVLSLLNDGLDCLLADSLLDAQSVVAFASARTPSLRQPQPLDGVCKVYARAGRTPPALRCQTSLLSPDMKALAQVPAADFAWTHRDERIEAGLVKASLPTKELPDGTYTLRFAITGQAVNEMREVKVELGGERWTALKKAEHERRKLLEPNLLGTLGDYDSEPRTPEGRVDISRLLEQIRTAHMNTYDWLIWHADSDWEDFRRFLPIARETHLKVWVTLCPPSGQGGGYPWSEPHRLDYLKWADEIGKLSKEYDNLVALVIDDFWSSPNWKLFTPDYVAALTATLRQHNPKLAFLPTIYWPTVGDADWIEAYGPAIDGIVFPYCEYETGDDLAAQLAACRQWIGPDKFLLVNVYGSGSGGGQAPPRTAEYMRKALTVSREQSDGIRIYCLPKDKLLDDPRYAVTAELYGKWGAEPPR